jgi:hypothetical protein
MSGLRRRPVRDVIATSHEVAESGCWLWTAATNADGYGLLWRGNRSYLMAHRASYELHVGPIPEGLTIDHLCRNRRCINPAHLEPVTNRTNVLRGAGITAQNAAKTHCIHGHPYDEQNTYLRRDGARACRICKREVQRRAAARSRAVAA